MTPEQKAWIDNASYEDMLRKWRFAPSGYPFFVAGTAVWLHFKDTMDRKRKEVGQGGHVAASKRIGWG